MKFVSNLFFTDIGKVIQDLELKLSRPNFNQSLS